MNLKSPLIVLLLILFVIPAYANAEKNILIRSQQAHLLILSYVRDVSLIELELIYKFDSLPFTLGLVGMSSDLKSDEIAFFLDNNHKNRKSKVKSEHIGLRVDLPLSGVPFKDSYYFSFALLYGSFDSEEELTNVSDCTNKYNSKGTVNSVAMSFGYQWFWDSGYHATLGAGFLENNAKDRELKVENNCSTPDINVLEDNFLVPMIDLALGFAF